MSFTMFDIHDLTTITAFRGFRNQGYIMYSDTSSNKLYYKNFTSNINTTPFEFITDIYDEKLDISAYSNPYAREIAFCYRTANNNIYLAIIQETSDGKLFLEKTDALIMTNAKQPVIVFDAYAYAYILFYIDINTNEMFQAMYDPYDVFKSKILVDSDFVIDTEPVFGSDFRLVALASSQKALNNITNMYSIEYDNRGNKSIKR